MSDISNTVFHTAIIGAGASGLMCAGSFSQRKIVIEHNPIPGAKVAVSGGGKCNFSNRYVTAANYQSQNKHFCKNALAAYTTQDFLNLLQSCSIAWQQRQHGQLFATNAQEIVRLLLRRAKEHNTLLELNTQALDITRENDLFIIRTSAGLVRARHLVIATGGLSFPDLGASAFSVKAARQLGLDVVEQRPALAAFIFPQEQRAVFKPLAGNSLPVHIETGKFEYEESLLFTHDGVSGPAVLQASLFWREGAPVSIDFLPGTDAACFFNAHKNSQRNISSVLEGKISTKIAKVLLGELDRDLSNAPKSHLCLAAERLNHFKFIPYLTAGYSRAEATAGGVDTRQINPSTMQTKKDPDLYFIGEALDVTGMVGGYNLQWAWSSAVCAARSLQNT